MARNPLYKKRPKDRPYLVIEDAFNPSGPTTFRVLKVYQKDPEKPGARVLVHTTSPCTGPSGDYGDSYWSDVRGVIVECDPLVTEEILPWHLKLHPWLVAAIEQAGNPPRVEDSVRGSASKGRAGRKPVGPELVPPATEAGRRRQPRALRIGDERARTRTQPLNRSPRQSPAGPGGTPPRRSGPRPRGSTKPAR